MANTLAPFGFMPVRRLDGAPWTGNQSYRLIANGNSTAIFYGDAVTSLASGYIQQSAAGDTQIAGVFVGCRYYSSVLQRPIFANNWPGSGATGDVDAYIIDDPWCVFLAQSGGGSGNPVGIDKIDQNIKISTATAGNSTTGVSGMVADDNNIATTSTFPFRIIAVPGQAGTSASPKQTTSPLVQTVGAPSLISPAANGYDATTKFNLVLVTFNSQDFKSLTGI